MSTIIYPVPYIPADALSYAFQKQVPIKYPCPILTGGLYTNPNDLWNCNRCGSSAEFYAPFERGDIIPFQTNFADNYNSPNSVLTAGIKGNISPVNYYVEIELQDGNGTAISTNADDFCSDYYVAYSDETGSIQTWYINTGLFPANLKCFKIKITYYRLTSGIPTIERVIYSDEFRENTSCRNTVLIQSTYSDSDCFGNFYGISNNYFGTNNIPFYNSIRLFGDVEFVGEDDETETNDRGIVIKRTIRERYQIESGLYPAYFVKRISQTVRGNAIFVDAVEYKNFVYPDKLDGTKMFGIDLTFEKECILDNRKCNF